MISWVAIPNYNSKSPVISNLLSTEAIVEDIIELAMNVPIFYERSVREKVFISVGFSWTMKIMSSVESFIKWAGKMPLLMIWNSSYLR